MSLRNLVGGVAVVSAVAGAALLPANAALAAPATSTGASASASSASTTAKTATFITVTSKETFIPSTLVTITGEATPHSDVYVNMPGIPVLNEKTRSDADGHWEFTPRIALSGNIGNNKVTVVTADGNVAQAEFAIHDAYPESTHDEAAFRPILVSDSKRETSGTYRVTGSATPGALVIVRSPGLTQGVTLAGNDGAWTVSLTSAAFGGGSWVRTEAYEQHATGTDLTTFVLNR